MHTLNSGRDYPLRLPPATCTPYTTGMEAVLGRPRVPSCQKYWMDWPQVCLQGLPRAEESCISKDDAIDNDRSKVCYLHPRDNSEGPSGPGAPRGAGWGLSCDRIIVRIPPSGQSCFLLSLTDVGSKCTPQQTSCPANDHLRVCFHRTKQLLLLSVGVKGGERGIKRISIYILAQLCKKYL